MATANEVGKRVRELVEEHGPVRGFGLVMDELGQRTRRSESFQMILAKMEQFQKNQIEPLADQYLSEEKRNALVGSMERFLSGLKEEKPDVRKSLAKRVSERLGLTSRRELPEEDLPIVEAQIVEGGEEGDLSAEVPVDVSEKKLQWAARLQTGYEGNLTDQQSNDLEIFREMMYSTEYKEDILQSRDGPDRLLLRFLRAECSKKRKFNLEKSKKRLIKTLQWRRDNNIDDLLHNKPAEWEKYLAVTGEKEVVDEEGRVVVFTQAGHLIRTMNINEFSMDVWKKCTACMVEHRLETLRKESEKRGYEVSAMVMVYDLQGGMTLAARRMVPFIKMLNGIAAQHYPELIDIIYVPSCPKIFNVLYGFIQGFLDPVTKEKVKLYTSSQTDQKKFTSDISKHVRADRLPQEYGGEGGPAWAQ